MIAFAYIQYQELPIGTKAARESHPTLGGRHHLSARPGGNENALDPASESVRIAEPPDQLALHRIVELSVGSGKARRRLFCGRRRFRRQLSGRFLLGQFTLA